MFLIIHKARLFPQMPKDHPPFTQDDGITTSTLREQRVVENRVFQIFQNSGYPQEDRQRYFSILPLS